MANERLRRTPTFSGNRRTHTWSGWVKRNQLGAWERLFSTAGQTLLQLTGSSPPDQIRYLDQTGANYDLRSNILLRDVGSWMHIVLSVDHSQTAPKDRVRIYLNGVEVDFYSTDSSSNGAQNLQTFFNSVTEHSLLGRETANAGENFRGEAFDIFWVDGQALTPEVFGFYKDGKGYQSSGTKKVTDFRPGQWSPRLPKSIKHEINRLGGFGVNGFYLPMNDSSNFGADFHCDPDTIIKLKGEDLPQPRNGAPDTSDAYVSELRDDPYAANLVLAMPLISGGQNNSYGDYSADIKGSGTNKTVTAVGSPSITNTPSHYGSALVDNNSTSDYLTVTGSGTDFRLDPAQEDWTVEFWVNPYTRTSPRHTSILQKGDATTNNQFDWRFYIGVDVGIDYDFTFGIGGDTGDSIEGNGNQLNLAPDQWHHCCVEAYNGTITKYINGVAYGVNTSPPAQTTTYTDLQIFRADLGGAGDVGFIGALSDLRIYSGVAKYKGGFDVPKPYTPLSVDTWRQLPDTCRNNFATWNTISGNETSGQFSFADGNLTASTTSSNVTVTSNFGMSSGKWYWEYCPSGIENFHDIGISHLENPPLGFDDGTLSASWRTSTGQVRQGNTDVQATGLSASAGDIVQIAFDADTRKMWVGVNGSYFGGADPATGTNTTYQTNLTASTYFFAASLHQSGTTNTHTGIANFGQNPTFSGTKTAGTNADSNGKGLFKYAPPTGFLALCTDNLSTPAVADPGKHFKAVLYTGSGNVKSINKVGFKPDLVWLKCRTDGKWHALVDSVRGNTKTLFSNDNTVEVSEIHVPSFNSDGFTVADIDSGTANENEFDYVAWCWKAGGPTVTNNDGSITSQVSVNQDAGFSIVSYTGNGSSSATVGHGLNKTPAFSIVKSRDGGSVQDWWVYIGSDDLARARLNLPNPATVGDNSNALKHAPDTSVFTLTNFIDNNIKYIVYSWAEVENYSKVGTYIGNGNDDGPMIVCGFKPAWVMVKRLDSGANEGWPIYDNVRGSVNPNPKGLYANDPLLENDASGRYKDFLSNGFKIKGTSGEQNTDGITYAYIAFAESPLQTANAK